MKSKRYFIVIFVIVAITVLIVALINIRSGKQNTGSSSAQFKGGRPRMGGVVTVRSAPATEKILTDFIETNGEIESVTQVEVFPNMGGKIARVLKHLGDPVKKHETIMLVDPTEPGSYYSLSPVESPISGAILTTPLKPGVKVTTGTAVTKVGDIDNLEVRCAIPERFSGDLAIGLKGVARLVAFPGVEFPITLTAVSPVLDPATRTKEVTGHFDNPDSRVNSGMYSTVRLWTKVYPASIVVNKDCVINDGKKSYIFIANALKAEKREVTLGNTIDLETQVLSGVRVGERVIVEGLLTLADGSDIKDISIDAPIKTGFEQNRDSQGGKDSSKGARGGKGLNKS